MTGIFRLPSSRVETQIGHRLRARISAGIVGLLLPIAATGFNLGEPQVNSTIGAPLDLTIPVELHDSDASGDYLRAELADWRVYEESQIPEVFDRQTATLSIEGSASGKPVIRLRTNVPVIEPLVPLLLDVRLGPVLVRRSYSVFLDPPAGPPSTARRSQAAPAAATRTITTTALPPRSVPAPAPLPQRRERPLPAAGPAPTPPPGRNIPLSGAVAVVQPNESLGEFSQRVRRNPATRLDRMMRDIYLANPHAFGGSPDIFWAGAEIRVPAEDGVHRLPLQSGPVRYNAPIVAPAVVVADRAGKLTSSLSSASISALPVTAFPIRPILSSDWMPWARFPASRLSVELASAPRISPAPSRRVAEAPVPVEEPAIAETSAAAPTVAADEAATESTPETAATPAAAVEARPRAETGTGVTAAATTQSPTAPAATAVERPAIERTGGFWRTSIGLGLLLLLGWLIWVRRRDDEVVLDADPREAALRPPISREVKPAELDPVGDAVANAEARILAAINPEEPEPETEAAEEFETDSTLTLSEEPVELHEPGPEPDAAQEPEPAPEPKVVNLPTRARDEKIEVVENQLPASGGELTGFYADVAQMLTSTLEANPSRRDVRLKLLEVYFAAGLADEFLKNTGEYLEILAGQHDENWTEIAEMGRQLFPQHEWFLSARPPSVGDNASKSKKSAGHNFNRYYEGVDQWKLRGALEQLAKQYETMARDPEFAEFRKELLQRHAGRPSPLVHASALSTDQDGAQIYLKREPRHGNGHDHLINAVGQVALASRTGRTGVLTATTNGLHGLATAVVARALKLQCKVFIDQADARANHSRVLRIQELGAEIEHVRDTNTMDVDARRTAMTEWLENPKEFLYITSLASGPHPYPTIMHENLALVGIETREQLKMYSQRPPAAIVAGTTDGPAGIGIMQAFLDETQTRLYCAEIPGVPQRVPQRVSDRLVGSPITALREHDWPREHAWLRDTRRVQYGTVSELEANNAISAMYEHERLMLSRDGAQVVAYAIRIARALTAAQSVVVLLPSQNDADAHFVESRLNPTEDAAPATKPAARKTADSRE